MGSGAHPAANSSTDTRYKFHQSDQSAIKYNWPLLKQHVDHVQLVDENEIKHAMRLLFDIFGMVVEPSGAVSFASLLQRNPTTLKGDIVCVISGGNVDQDQFLHWIRQPRS